MISKDYIGELTFIQLKHERKPRLSKKNQNSQLSLAVLAPSCLLDTEVNIIFDLLSENSCTFNDKGTLFKRTV